MEVAAALVQLTLAAKEVARALQAPLRTAVILAVHLGQEPDLKFQDAVVSVLPVASQMEAEKAQQAKLVGLPSQGLQATSRSLVTCPPLQRATLT